MIDNNGETDRVALVDYWLSRMMFDLSRNPADVAAWRQDRRPSSTAISNRCDQTAAAFTNSPRVDAALFNGVGHCIDFHRLAGAFHLEQLAFALRCCVQPGG